MAESGNPIAVYLEIGKKRTLAGALDWPGWCRGGRDEAAALDALRMYGPRYARVLQATDLRFPEPAGAPAFAVLERLPGNGTTDFGTPDVAPSGDAAPVGTTELRRLQALLEACWAALDTAAGAAAGKELRTGPRGGGRALTDVLGHVRAAEASYLTSLGGTLRGTGDMHDPNRATGHDRQVILDALAAAVRGEFPARGPRGGTRWAPRYFVRRAAWHILDHAWEIEDRIL